MKVFPVHMLALILWLYAASGAIAADVWRRLDAAAIRAQIVGKTATDDSHWSDRYVAGGVFDAMELGRHKAGSWRIQGNEMCVTPQARKSVEECFEIWMAKDRIEYRRDGVTLTTAFLRDK